MILPLLQYPRDGRALSVFPNNKLGIAAFKHKGERNRKEPGTNTALQILFLSLMLLLCKRYPRAQFVRLGAEAGAVALPGYFCTLQAVLTPHGHVTKGYIPGAITSSANLAGALLAESQVGGKRCVKPWKEELERQPFCGMWTRPQF